MPTQITYRFSANIPQICGIESVCKLADRLIVNVAMFRDGRSMNLQDFQSTLQEHVQLSSLRKGLSATYLLVRQADFHL
jgi:hypothetical protein